MKIMCQEHYDKVVQYAESIGDNMLRECLERLERRNRNPCCPCQIELYRDFAPIRTSSRNAIPTGVWASLADWSITATRINRIVSSTSRFTAG